MKALLATLLLLLSPALASAQVLLATAAQEWPYDPDLPQNVPTAALPANWNAAADHTPADNAALQELLDGDASGDAQAGDVIELDADVDYGTITIDEAIQGDANNWIIIRSDEYASLPTFSATDSSGRVVEADEQYMATISRAPTNALHHALSIPEATGGGAAYIRFIGIKFEATGSGYAGTNYIGPIAVGESGANPPAIADMPSHIGFDRCIITQGDDVDSWENTLNATDSFFVGCCFHNLWGGGNDGSNAVRTYSGARILIANNYFECIGAAWFIGDNVLCEFEDGTFTRNYHIRPVEWNDGNHGVNKGSIETKLGLRVEISENVFQNHWNTGGFGVITLKAEGEGGPKTCTHVTVRGNLMFDCEIAMVLLVGGSADDADVGPNADWLIEHNLAYNVTTRGINFDCYDNNSSQPFRRLQLRHNTIISGTVFNNYQSGASMEDGSTPGEDFVFTDNVLYGAMFVNNGFPGAEALNWGWGADYVATHNVFLGTTYNAAYYDSDASPAPLGTLTNNNFPTDLAGFGFTDSDNDDYSISNGSDWATSSSTVGKPGYDAATYDAIWTGVMGL